MKPLRNDDNPTLAPIGAFGRWNKQPVSHQSRVKAYCKAEFDDVLAQIKTYQRNHQLSEQALGTLYTSLIAYYVGCLLETEFEVKMDRWSSRLIKSWTKYEGGCR